MKTIRKVSAFAISIILLSMVGCLENSTEPEVIVDYGASSYFYAKNQTGSDLELTYKIAFLDMDSTVTVPADSTFQIFQAGDIGMPPKPSDAFQTITVYRLSENQSSLFLTIDPVTDSDWIMVDDSLNEIDSESTDIYGDDGSARYQLILADSETE